MRGSEYYYGEGISPNRWDNMLYFEAIEDRRNLARDLYFKLYKIQEESETEMPFDFRLRLGKVESAWKLNQKLLDERSLIV
jgi:hypothetical protein